MDDVAVRRVVGMTLALAALASLAGCSSSSVPAPASSPTTAITTTSTPSLSALASGIGCQPGTLAAFGPASGAHGTLAGSASFTCAMPANRTALIFTFTDSGSEADWTANVTSHGGQVVVAPGWAVESDDAAVRAAAVRLGAHGP